VCIGLVEIQHAPSFANRLSAVSSPATFRFPLFCGSSTSWIHLQALPILHNSKLANFRISKFKKTKNKIRVITLWNTRLIFLCRNGSAGSDKVGLRTFLGNKTGGRAVMRRPIVCVCVAVSIPTGISCVKYGVGYIYTQFLFAQNYICTRPSGTKNIP